MQEGILLATVLALWAAVCIYDWFGTKLFWALRPLIAGFVAGIIVGDVAVGMTIGATLELAALGVYSYGGVSIPDYSTGAIIGTAVAAAASGGLAAQIGVGLAVALPVAVLLIGLDTLAKSLTIFWIHRADRYAAEARARAITVMHFTAFIPHALARAVPTFIAVLILNSAVIQGFQTVLPKEFTPSMQLFANILPALGFAMLLTMMPIKRYWYFLLLGFVLFAYLKLPLVGLALLGLVVTVIYMVLRYQNADRPKIPDGPSDSNASSHALQEA